MKLAILLPGFLDSPDYTHMKVFEERLHVLGYTVVRLDPCELWSKGNIEEYTATNYLTHIRKALDAEIVDSPEEVIVIGHSFGGFMAIIAGSKFPEITKVISLCSPSEMDGGLSKVQKDGFRISKRDLPQDPTQVREFKIPVSFYYDSKHYSVIDSVGQLHKPLMIVIGLEDTVVPPADTEKIVIAAHDPYVVRLEGLGHDFRKSQKDSEVVMDEIEKFLLT